MAHQYDVGSKIWSPNAEEGWIGGEVVRKQVHGEKVTLQVALANGEVRHVPRHSAE